MVARHCKSDGLITFLMIPGMDTNVKFRQALQSGADVNYESTDGMTPLRNAIINGNIIIGKILIENGADVNYESNDGYTPLIYAIMYKQKEFINLLIENDADVNHITIINISPLLKAVEIGDAEIIKLLIENGADVNKKIFNHKENKCMSLLEIINNDKLIDNFSPAFFNNRLMITQYLRKNRWQYMKLTI